MGRKSKGRLHRPEVSGQQAAGALAAGDVISSNTAGVVGTREFLIGTKLTWSNDGFTSGEGPIEVGLAHPDYSPAEIEEFRRLQPPGTLAIKSPRSAPAAS